jgi:hypothetical protein
LKELVCIPAQIWNSTNCLIFMVFGIYLLPREWYISSKKLSFFQLATGGIESAVYKKLIAPFKNDLPVSHVDGFRRVCADHNYAYVAPSVFNTKFLLTPACQLVPLPESYYRKQWAFVISKNSSYKGLINWRWDKYIKSIRYMADNLRLLCVLHKVPKAGELLLLFIRHKRFN